MSKLQRMLGILLTVGSVLSGVSPCPGQALEPRELYVNDFARLLSAEEVAEVRSSFESLRQRRGIEATVVTIDSISDYPGYGRSVPGFATALFNDWGVGNAERSDGVMLLVAREQREVRIELGAGHASEANAHMARIIEREIVPRFKQNDFGGGIVRGARALAVHFSRAPAEQRRDPLAESAERQRSRAVEDRTPPSEPSFWQTVTNWRSVLWGLLVGLVGFGAVRARRLSRVRKCPHCAVDMKRLDETSDDVHLDSGQKVEEALGSVDWRVWECPQCEAIHIDSRRAWFSRYNDCPDCGRRAVWASTRTLEHPTTWSTGLQEVVLECAHCPFRKKDTRTLARLSDSGNDSSRGSSSSWSSSSSFGGGGGRSGSSFGGGRSSGGGASGKW